MAQDKTRLDQLLVQRGLAASRERARALIMTGDVLVSDRPVDKPGTRVATDAEVRLRGADHPYVGRGGLKLAGALEDLAVDVGGLRCLDVGASTGGFTDCLLRHGAVAVVAVDVGTNQLHWRLRSDDRVTVFEQTDIRALDPATAGAPFPLAVVDTSFISLRLVLPPTAALIEPGGQVLAMLKPQFEVGRADVAKGGVVKDPVARTRAIDEIVAFAAGIGLTLQGQADSRVPGAKKGNLEHFLLMRR